MCVFSFISCINRILCDLIHGCFYFIIVKKRDTLQLMIACVWKLQNFVYRIHYEQNKQKYTKQKNYKILYFVALEIWFSLLFLQF